MSLTTTMEERDAARESRRLAHVRVSFGLWEEFIKGRLQAVSWSTTPADLLVLGIEPSADGSERGDIDVLIYSESFDPVPEDAEIPLAKSFMFHVEYQPVGLTREEGEALGRSRGVAL